MSNISIQCAITNFEENRRIKVTRNKHGVVDSEPVEGSERAILDLLLPNGVTIKAEIQYVDFVTNIVPFLSQKAT